MTLNDDMFRQPTNSLPEDTRPVPAAVDIISLLQDADLAYDPAMDAVDATEDVNAPSDEDEIVDAEFFPVEDAFPIDAYDLPAPPPEQSTAAPDMSSLLPAMRDLELAMEPVSVDELRRFIDAGALMDANKDPFGERLRYTIRRLVRGI